MEIYNYIEERVKEENGYVKEEFGEDYYFSDDDVTCCFGEKIPEHLIVKYKLDRDEPCYTSDKDAIKALKAYFDQWVKDTDVFSWDNIEDKIRKIRNDNARDARTQAAEMGYHDYYGGSYHQSEYVDSLWSRHY
tara:strand:- start:869 stop:1270 length:402 start_codon:yes stop_codon:yes gene_type:complete